MSHGTEAIVARHEGMRVAGISCLCNMAAGILPQALTHQESWQPAPLRQGASSPWSGPSCGPFP